MLFKKISSEEYHDLAEEKNVTSWDARCHLANEMQEIIRALEHLAMLAVADKNTVTRLIDAVESLMWNNVSLTAQLSDAMNLNLEMYKKININPSEEPEDKITAENAKIKGVF